MEEYSQNIFLHVDLDAFFASCEERENPQFAGMPIVVGADPAEGKGRGVVSTANYAARKYGIGSAMPISRAWRLCPTAIFLPVNGTLYRRVSESIMSILRETAQTNHGMFKQAGADEAYLDVSGAQTYKKAIAIAQSVQRRIRRKEKITASVGIAPSMLVAKIASDFQKPAGITAIEPEYTQDFLDLLPIQKIPGIGPKTARELGHAHIKTVGDLRKIPQSTLYEQFGQYGITLFESARGIDRQKIVTSPEKEKSISEEYTFAHDTNNMQEILPVLFSLVRNVLKTTSLRKHNYFKTATVKVRYSDFTTHTKSLSGSYAPKDTDALEKIALKLLWPFTNRGRKIRLIGFRVNKFL